MTCPLLGADKVEVGEAQPPTARPDPAFIAPRREQTGDLRHWLNSLLDLDKQPRPVPLDRVRGAVEHRDLVTFNIDLHEGHVV